MVEPGNPDLSIGKQCKLPSIPRSWVCYQPKGEMALNLALMRQIDGVGNNGFTVEHLDIFTGDAF